MLISVKIAYYNSNEVNYNRLKQAIKDSKISRKEIALLADVTPKTIDNILAGGDPKVSTIEAIATAIGVNVKDLFGSSETTVLIGDGSQLNQKGSHHNKNISSSCNAEVLEIEVKMLKEKIVDKEERLREKDERIKELKERIDELKERK